MPFSHIWLSHIFHTGYPAIASKVKPRHLLPSLYLRRTYLKMRRLSVDSLPLLRFSTCHISFSVPSKKLIALTDPFTPANILNRQPCKQARWFSGRSLLAWTIKTAAVYEKRCADVRIHSYFLRIKSAQWLTPHQSYPPVETMLYPPPFPQTSLQRSPSASSTRSSKLFPTSSKNSKSQKPIRQSLRGK